jgi:hypothetical protein
LAATDFSGTVSTTTGVLTIVDDVILDLVVEGKGFVAAAADEVVDDLEGGGICEINKMILFCSLFPNAVIFKIKLLKKSALHLAPSL